jgi:hypothetical protein
MLALVKNMTRIAEKFYLSKMRRPPKSAVRLCQTPVTCGDLPLRACVRACQPTIKSQRRNDEISYRLVGRVAVAGNRRSGDVTAGRPFVSRHLYSTWGPMTSSRPP